MADRIVADFELAVVARQAFPAPAGRASRLQRRPGPVRSWPAMPVSTGPPAPGPVPGRVVRLGQVIPVPGDPGGSEVYLLSYAQTGPGHQLSVFVRPTRQVDSAGPEAGILEQFTATDDRGTRYQMTVSNLGGGPAGWTLLLEPSPPHDPRWLDLITAPGQPAVRVSLDRPARPPHDATVSAGWVTASPGGRRRGRRGRRAACPRRGHARDLGLHNCLGRTVAHMHASGPMNELSYSPAELYYWLVTWIRDGGRAGTPRAPSVGAPAPAGPPCGWRWCRR